MLGFLRFVLIFICAASFQGSFRLFARSPQSIIHGTVDYRHLAVTKKAFSEYQKAMRDVESGNNQKAIERLENALKISPDFYEAHWQLGVQYVTSNQRARAEAELARAAELNPRVPDPLMALGLLYVGSHRFKEAKEVLSRAVELNPASGPALYYLASVLYETKDFDRAEELLKQSLQLDPSLHSARLALVNLYLLKARSNEAFRELEAYLQRAPQDRQTAQASQLRDQLAQRLQIKTSRSD